MALNWDCSPAKSCYDVGWARYTMNSPTTKTQDDEVVGMTRGSTPPRKVRLAWQQPSGNDRNKNSSLKAGQSAQDICNYPASAFGPPFAPPRYRIIVAYAASKPYCWEQGFKFNPHRMGNDGHINDGHKQ